jgi:hypothetical protein
MALPIDSRSMTLLQLRHQPLTRTAQAPDKDTLNPKTQAASGKETAVKKCRDLALPLSLTAISKSVWVIQQNAQLLAAPSACGPSTLLFDHVVQLQQGLAQIAITALERQADLVSRGLVGSRQSTRRCNSCRLASVR